VLAVPAVQERGQASSRPLSIHQRKRAQISSPRKSCFPVLKRQNEGLALGYVTARIVESTFITIGIVSLLAIVTLRQDVGGASGAGSLVPIGRPLVAIHDWTFLLGPGWIVGARNQYMLTPSTAAAFTGSYRGTTTLEEANAQRPPLPPLLWWLSW